MQGSLTLGVVNMVGLLFVALLDLVVKLLVESVSE
jgi:hypothetical protein